MSCKSILLLNCRAINEGSIYETDVFIKNRRIERIDDNLSHLQADIVIDAAGKFLMPGVIDDQVHFREPGLTHKAEIYTEAKAAVAGGVTTFMEMPNTQPPALTQELLEEKYQIAARRSLANYSFYMGASNDNLDEVLRTDPQRVCGIKVFMGSSTGNLLVDNYHTLEKLFKEAPILIATHCEDEATIRANMAAYRKKYGDNPPASIHPEVRNVEACLKSSRMAVELAKKYNTRLHVLHISTGDEAFLFDNQTPLAQKRITAEVCVHHLWFSKEDYEPMGNLIKCNPAIKEAQHREALWTALHEGYFDVIATDHAPHTWEEKQRPYWEAPSGLPLVQHSLLIMLHFARQDWITLPQIVEKMCHAPAVCFNIRERGFLREGYWADLVLFDMNQPFSIEKGNIYYKCGWSPLEGFTFPATITHTIVSGHLAYVNGQFDESQTGERLLFDRD
jgi:dihydroorotase